MNVRITRASDIDITDLRRLYTEADYHEQPAEARGGRESIAELIATPDTRWMVAKSDSGDLLGSVMVHLNPANRVGRLEGLVVHPDRHGDELAGQLCASLCDELLSSGAADSVYAGVPANREGAQRVLTEIGFRCYGVLPNLVDSEDRETLALFVRHAGRVLDRRVSVLAAPDAFWPLLQAVERVTGTGYANIHLRPTPPVRAAKTPLVKYEVVDAPQFVRRRFQEQVSDPARLFYPTLVPNVMILPPDGRFEVYVALHRTGGHCALLGVDPGILAFSEEVESLIAALTQVGATYMGVLLPLADVSALSAFLCQDFVPVAIYPAMRRIGNVFHDYAVLSRTIQPIDFDNMVDNGAIHPYIEAYLSHRKTSGH